MSKRGLDIKCLVRERVEVANLRARQSLAIRQGIDQETAKKLAKLVRESKLKVQVSIQGEKLRVAGKKRDDLQKVIGIFKEAKLDIPLQFENFRD